MVCYIQSFFFSFFALLLLLLLLLLLFFYCLASVSVCCCCVCSYQMIIPYILIVSTFTHITLFLLSSLLAAPSLPLPIPSPP